MLGFSMDPPNVPRLVRLSRNDSFPLLPYSPRPIIDPHLHPPCATAHHHVAPLPPGFPWNHYEESRRAFINPPVNNVYLPSPHHSNSTGFDSPTLPFPSVSDRAYHAPPHGSTSLVENWKRPRVGGIVVDKPGGFYEMPGQFQQYENLLKTVDPYADRRARRRLESDRLLLDGTDWRNQRQLRVWDERGSHCNDPFFEQLPPEGASLATETPPLSSTRGLRSACSVNSRCGDESCLFIDRPPRSSLHCGRSFSDPYVVHNNAATKADSQVIGNGLGPHPGQSICKKKNYDRDVPDHGFRERQYNAAKESDSINVAEEGGFWSSNHMVRKPLTIPTMDYEPELKEDCFMSSKGKKKMSDFRNAKYYASPTKRPMQRPSAFSRIQSRLSVWDRLEEKQLIFTSPGSLACTHSSPPRMPDETKANAGILDFSIEVNAPSVVEPSSIEQSPTKVAHHVENPIEKHNRIRKKKKKKKSQIRGEMQSHIIIVSTSSNEPKVAKISNVSSSGSHSVPTEISKVELPSCIHGSESITCFNKNDVKKLPVVKMHGAKEATKIVNHVEDCTIEIPMMKEAIGTLKFEAGDKYVEKNGCVPNDDTEGKTINDNHLQLCQQGILMQATQTSDVNAKIVSGSVNQAQDHMIETKDDGSAESLDLMKTFDYRFRSSLVSDILVTSQPSECIIPFNKVPLNNVAMQDSSIYMVENNAANPIKQDKLKGTGSIKSCLLEIEGDMPPANVASLELIGDGEVFVSTGPTILSYIDDSLSCKSAEIVKQQEKVGHFTTTTESEIAGKSFSSQSYLHGIQEPSFSEISHAASKQKLLGEKTGKVNREFKLHSFSTLPQSGCYMTSQESLVAPIIDANDTRLEQALPLEPMKMVSPASQYCDSIEFISNMSTSNKDKKHGGNCETFVRTMMSSASESLHESCKTIKNHHIIPERAEVLPFHAFNKPVLPNAKSTGREFFYEKILHPKEVPRFLSNTKKNSGQLKEAVRRCQAGRHRTWLRTNAHLHSDENQKRGQTSCNLSPKKLEKIQNSSYIRKGNSLIRKLGVESPPVLLPAVVSANSKFKTFSERGIMSKSIGEIPDNATPSYPLLERPKTPPLPPPSKLLDCTMNSCIEFPQLRQVNTSPETETDEGNKHHGVSESLPFGNFRSEDNATGKRVEAINPKSAAYFKHRKNHLVAAPDPEVADSSKFLTEMFKLTSHHPTKRSKAVPYSSSYLYYRSNRNQLIRSAHSSVSQVTGIPACHANSIDLIQRRKTLPLKRLVHKRAKQPTISSLVWMLSGDKLSQKSIATLGCQRVFPNLFPWKRVVNWKSFMMNDRIPISSRSSLSMISQKLQHLRKRDAIYKVSTDGFSLRKTGIVSIGGSNLKWSKSIDKRSKKASEEATLAVAEVERNKRERKKIKSTCRNRKKKLGLTCRPDCGTCLKQGDRIFRVGSARYKMDSSKRTLIRIPDVLSSSNQQPGKNCLKAFVPRRLIIGNNEYVRVGNGNQLVRDPKKLQRILASEKIRWSLHTARLKLAQKCQYCLFFTRFGKCNKSGGKCPYIHDPSKISICTKFLRSQCSDTNCKLTHKVIPERMPDCSYFLKGLCTNINCPYRHVKVNANAPLCDGFLRGHCADGDECHKKHSYTCPLFEATGRCPQGSLCKLRHPKNQSKSRKRKRSNPKSSSLGRYFCSSIETAGEFLKVASSQNDMEDLNDVFCSDGRFTEFINLDADSDAAGIESNVVTDSGKLDSGYLGMQPCDILALIKPVRIMNNDDLTIF